MTKFTIFLSLLLFSKLTYSDEILIGAKKFTEGNISAHIVSQLISRIDPSQKTRVLENLGGTGIVTAAIKSKEVDIYVDYTGTLINSFKSDRRRLEDDLLKEGIYLGPELGFNNSYGLAVGPKSSRLKISDIKESDRIGVSHEFYKRKDGYESLKDHYGFNITPTAVEHSLLYNSLSSDHLDIIEVYTTDAKIRKNNLRVLKDDKKFFPRYDAVVLVNKEFMEDNAELVDSLFTEIEKNIDNNKIMNANYLVEEQGLTYAQAAGHVTKTHVDGSSNELLDILPYFLDHFKYLIITVILCVVVGVPLGAISAKSKKMEKWIVGTVSVLQTIPSLALLVFLIPIFGLGEVTTLIALVLYGLLPIVKNTYNGVKNIPTELIEFSDLIQMSKLQKLFIIELPLAKEEILTGVRITSVMTVGLTVIASFIGAGGLGMLIVTGLSLNDTDMILRGAIPSALMALVIEFFFQRILPLFSRVRG